ncbi:hypothetical protein Tco_1242141 [Tanacetum coccineum]
MHLISTTTNGNQNARTMVAGEGGVVVKVAVVSVGWVRGDRDGDRWQWSSVEVVAVLTGWLRRWGSRGDDGGRVGDGSGGVVMMV